MKPGGVPRARRAARWYQAAAAAALIGAIGVAPLPVRASGADQSEPGKTTGGAGRPSSARDRGEGGDFGREGEVLTLAEAVQMAVGNNVAIENARIQAAIRRHEAEAIRTEQYPNFGVAFLGQ